MKNSNFKVLLLKEQEGKSPLESLEKDLSTYYLYKKMAGIWLQDEINALIFQKYKGIVVIYPAIEKHFTLDINPIKEEVQLIPYEEKTTQASILFARNTERVFSSIFLPKKIKTTLIGGIPKKTETEIGKEIKDRFEYYFDKDFLTRHMDVVEKIRLGNIYFQKRNVFGTKYLYINASIGGYYTLNAKPGTTPAERFFSESREFAIPI